MLLKLVCPHCRHQLTEEQGSLKCPACQKQFPSRQGIISFLEAQESFNPTSFADKQERAWSSSAQLRDRIRHSRLLSFLNRVRIQFSLSGRRDRIFQNELRRATPNQLILDLGCGGGRHYFCHYGKVVGVDPVLELLQIAKEIYQEVYHASGFALPFADNTFDYVVSSDVIGHIPARDKDRLFAEMYRVLRPGGRTVHLIETDATNIWFRFAHAYPELFQKYFVDRPGHISLEMPSELRARFRRHGFKQIRFKKFASTIQECGLITTLFDNEYKRKGLFIRIAVAVDSVLSRNLVVKEITNLLLEPAANLADRLTPFDSGSAALVIFEK